MKKSNVTVVIPCFNDGKYILEALNSVLNQTLKPEKIIVVDDGSKQCTKTLLKTISNPIVHVVFQTNKGPSAARNNGISLAKTDYILTLDADDYFDNTFIEKAVKQIILDDKIGVVGCYYRKLINNKISRKIIKPLGGEVSDFLVKNNGLSCSLFKKSLWHDVYGYDEHMRHGYEDWEFWISILKNDKKMVIIKEPLFTYRIKNSSRDKTALKLYDYKLKDYILEKHRSLYLKNFEKFSKNILYRNTRLLNDKTKLETSLEMRIGYAILLPFRRFKQLFNYKNRC